MIVKYVSSRRAGHIYEGLLRQLVSNAFAFEAAGGYEIVPEVAIRKDPDMQLGPNDLRLEIDDDTCVDRNLVETEIELERKLAERFAAPHRSIRIRVNVRAIAPGEVR